MEDGDLKQILELCRENNKILHSIQRTARVARFFRLVYWFLIIGSLVGSYYYLQPYLNKLLDVYKNLPLNQLDSLLKNK